MVRMYLNLPSLTSYTGVKRVRIPYSTVLDSHEDVIYAILKRYLSDNTKPFNASDFVVKLREIGDADWPIDIDNTEDLALALDTSKYLPSSD